MLRVSQITLEDDLDGLVDQINKAVWDDANDMAVYDTDSLRAYLERQDTILIACHEQTDAGSVLMGIASSRLELKPYDKERWLYVDEVDVCVDQRKKGAGKLIMKTLIKIAEDRGCLEVWLGTEVDNDAANALYRSLGPDDESRFVGYAFETGD
jgi:ribosomal protein S18 acetylase RimI-like enzyme